MNVSIKTSRGITLMPLQTKLLSERKIFVEGEIDSENACEFTKQIMYLSLTDSSKPISVLINSPGGEIKAGLLMYDVIQSCKTPIKLFCIGSAYSMAALLFACGKNGRFLLPHSELMLHEPLLGNRVGGNAYSIRSISDSLMSTREKINKLLALHTGRTEKEIEEATAFDHYFDAKEAVSFGLADEIITFDDIMEE